MHRTRGLHQLWKEVNDDADDNDSADAEADYDEPFNANVSHQVECHQTNAWIVVLVLVWEYRNELS